MALLDRTDPSETLEKKLVSMANTPEKLLQLIFDYQLVFSDEFANALALSLDQRGGLAGSSRPETLRKIKAINELSDRKVNKLIWEALETAINLRSQGPDNAKAQVRFIQGKNLVEALKNSPHRRIFEKLMRHIVRDSTLKYTGDRIDYREAGWYLNQSRPRLGYIFGIAFAVGVDFAVKWPYEPSFSQVALYAVAMGLPIGSMLNSVVFRPLMKGGTLQGLRDFFGRKPKYDLNINYGGQILSIKSNSVFDFLQWKLDPVSLELACKMNPCILSPPQIGYLGDVEILELEALGEKFRSATKLLDPGFVKYLEEKARTLYEKPSVEDNQISLFSYLKRYREAVGVVSQQLTLASHNLANRVQNLTQADLKTLGDIARQSHTQGQYSDTFELFQAKVQTDLQKLSDVKVNQEALSKKVESMDRLYERLRQLEKNEPQNVDQWREFAEEILVNLDELR